jgi:hypothetical protein
MRDWANPGATSRTYRRIFDPKPDPERWLFPGAVGVVMSAAGVYAARRERRTLSVALMWFAVGFIGSLGVHAFFHRFLFGHVPGFRALRVPARWANISYVGMSMLIAFATAALSRHRRWAGAVIAVVFIAELHAAPIRWYCTNPAVPDVYRWLRTQRGPIAELPLDTDSQYQYLRFATEHHLRTVNGISSFIPDRFFALAGEWSDAARRGELIADLRAIGVRLLVLHGDAVPAKEREWLRRAVDDGRLSYVRRFDHGVEGDWVFTFGGGTRHAPELDRYLRGEFTYNESTFGSLDYPRPNELLRRNAFFSGWTLSPWGIREVNFLFDNGGVRAPAKLIEQRSLNEAFPWYDVTTRPRYVAQFDRRPWYIGRDTDVQVEIIDGRGERTLLEGRWFRWE